MSKVEELLDAVLLGLAFGLLRSHALDALVKVVLGGCALLGVLASFLELLLGILGLIIVFLLLLLLLLLFLLFFPLLGVLALAVLLGLLFASGIALVDNLLCLKGM